MRVRAVILAGGQGERLGVLTEERTKPAVPFAGKYRIIDFALSNCVNSRIFDIMILAQYRPHSLIQHVGDGRPWDLDRGFTGGVRIFPPFTGRPSAGWQRGTGDAVWQNLTFLKNTAPDLVLVLSGDHVYAMDYRPLIAFHEDREADATICTIPVLLEQASRFGIVTTDETSRITRFVEKPNRPPGNLANMGVYLFKTDVLERVLEEDSQRTGSTHDFGRDVLPFMVAAGYRMFSFPFQGYWMDVGTLESYWRAHMDLLVSQPCIDLNHRGWVIHTRSEERPPVMIRFGAVVQDSLLTDGTVVESGARIERSALGPGVHVGEGAYIRESIILTDSRIGAGARVERAVVDKQVTIGEGAHVGEMLPEVTGEFLVTIGKGTQIPPATVVRPGAKVGSHLRPGQLSAVVGPPRPVEKWRMENGEWRVMEGGPHPGGRT